MPDYKNAKIYKIWSPEGPEIYIGSTTQSLSKRFHQHKSNRIYTSKILFEKYTDVRIELIECCPCDNKEELIKKEGGFIRTLDCVNKQVAGRTIKEYYEENKEQLLEKNKEYYEKNKEEIKEKSREHYDKNREQFLEQKKEYYEKHKEQILEQKKEHYEKHIEQIKAYKSQPYTCECGRTIRFGEKSRHFKSKIHKDSVALSQ